MLLSPLTPRQAVVLDFVRRFIFSNGYSPTVREIGLGLDISSPNGVTCHLRALEQKGAIRRMPRKPRTIVVTAA